MIFYMQIYLLGQHFPRGTKVFQTVAKVLRFSCSAARLPTRTIILYRPSYNTRRLQSVSTKTRSLRGWSEMFPGWYQSVGFFWIFCHPYEQTKLWRELWYLDELGLFRLQKYQFKQEIQHPAKLFQTGIDVLEFFVDLTGCPWKPERTNYGSSCQAPKRLNTDLKIRSWMG